MPQPYRTMPLPAAPPRAWRPILGAALAVFNALVLATFLYPLGPHPVDVGPLLALIGLLLRGGRGLRVCLTLPSGLLWLLAAAYIPLQTAVVRGYAHRGHPPVPPSWGGPIALATLCLVAGALTLEFAFVRLRAL